MYLSLAGDAFILQLINNFGVDPRNKYMDDTMLYKLLQRLSLPSACLLVLSLGSYEVGYARENTSDTTILYWDTARAPRMLPYQSFVQQRLKPWLAQRRQGAMPLNEGWLSLAPAWRGVQDSIELPALMYGYDANEGMLYFYVDSVGLQSTFDRSQRVPMKQFTKELRKPETYGVGGRPLYVLLGAKPPYRVCRVRALVRDACYNYWESGWIRVCTPSICYGEPPRYKRLNPLGLYPLRDDAREEELVEDKAAYKRLLRYGLISTRYRAAYKTRTH